MTSTDDALIAPSTGRRNVVVAFVPITVAIIGVAAILVGGISARQSVRVGPAAVDTMATGSVATSPSAVHNRDGGVGRGNSEARRGVYRRPSSGELRF